MPTAAEPIFPDSIIVLAVLATVLLTLITILLLRINARLAGISAKLSQSGHSPAREEPEPAPGAAEAAAGTHFEEFLNEDPERRSLPKKEQFKEYRKWRSEKGLNWSK